MKKFMIIFMCLCILTVPAAVFAEDEVEDFEEEYIEEIESEEISEDSENIDEEYEEEAPEEEYWRDETENPADVISVPDGITVILDGEIVIFDAAQPKFVNSRTMVPMRKMFEALGAEVNWDSTTNTAIATKGDMTVQISIGSNIMHSNGVPIEIDAPAQLIKSKTFVPVRFISNALGAEVDWDGENKIVYINTVK